jgi:hypothetical protein
MHTIDYSFPLIHAQQAHTLILTLLLKVAFLLLLAGVSLLSKLLVPDMYKSIVCLFEKSIIWRRSHNYFKFRRKNKYDDEQY